jgi:hypothetical protein
MTPFSLRTESALITNELPFHHRRKKIICYRFPRLPALQSEVLLSPQQSQSAACYSFSSLSSFLIESLELFHYLFAAVNCVSRCSASANETKEKVMAVLCLNTKLVEWLATKLLS